MLPEFSNSGGLPVGRPQHWSDVIEAVCRMTARAHERVELIGDQAQAQRIASGQALRQEGAQQPLTGVYWVVVGSRAVDHSIDQQLFHRGLPTRAIHHTNLLARRFEPQDTSGVKVQPALALQVFEFRPGTLRKPVAVHVPVAAHVSEKASALTER